MNKKKSAPFAEYGINPVVGTLIGIAMTAIIVVEKISDKKGKGIDYEK